MIYGMLTTEHVRYVFWTISRAELKESYHRVIFTLFTYQNFQLLMAVLEIRGFPINYSFGKIE
jgi:hypothetical protein